jgi:hypothetical protein
MNPFKSAFLNSKTLPHWLLGRSQAVPSVWPLHGYLQQVDLGEKRGNTVTNLLCLQQLLAGKNLKLIGIFSDIKVHRLYLCFQKLKICVFGIFRVKYSS